jgi:hypothetical protein
MTMDSKTLRTNERFKAASGVVTNLGSALLAGGFGRWFLLGFDPYVFQWLATAAMMIWSGLHLLNQLEADDADR